MPKGMVELTLPGDVTFADTLGRADKALYAAKNAWRNQVVAVWPETRASNMA